MRRAERGVQAPGSEAEWPPGSEAECNAQKETSKNAREEWAIRASEREEKHATSGERGYRVTQNERGARAAGNICSRAPAKLLTTASK